jgi:exosortase/archaeosortase family protein
MARLLFAIAALVLAFEPVVWLVGTWQDPAYASHGSMIAGAVALLFVWSVSSPIVSETAHSAKLALSILASSTLFRMASQLFAVNALGGLTLVADVYALGLLLRIEQRQRALSPGMLAAMFAFSLPLERIVQRSIGYPLQQLSADGACLLLKTTFNSVTCEGVRIVLDGRDVLVDLPCSGARGLLLTLLAFTVAAALARPSFRSAVIGGLVALASGTIANVMRISLLAAGIAHPTLFEGANVMQPPWHDTIGYLCLAMALVPQAIWMLSTPSHIIRGATGPTGDVLSKLWVGESIQLGLGAVSLALATFAVSLPRKPVDISANNLAIEAPAWIEDIRAEPRQISPREAEYFVQYGGSAAKAAYGPFSVMLVKTSSPLRHLHAPDECLRGMGFTVHYDGTTFSPVPSAHYTATAATGQRYRIDVSFLSDRGEITASVAGAVWLWINGQARTWTAIQRILPAEIPADQQAAFSIGALRALGIDFSENVASVSSSGG